MPQRSPRLSFVLTVAALGGCAPAAPPVTANPHPLMTNPPPPAEPAPPPAPAAEQAKKPEGVAWTAGLTGENAEHAKACDDGDASMCMSIGALYETGPQKDLPRALAVYQLGCDGGDKEACMSVGRMFLDGVGTAVNAEKGLALLTKACEERKHGDSCFLLGERYEKGQGVAKDPAQSKAFYGKACDNNFANGCAKAGKKKAK